LIPGWYWVNETSPGANWSVTNPNNHVEVFADEGCAQVEIINTFVPGCLEVTKVIDWNGTVNPDPSVSFEVCIEGPSYPDGECHIFTAGGSYTFYDLLPGVYWVNETDPGSEWSVTNGSTSVEVFPAAMPPGAIYVPECAEVEIINTYQPGCLEITKVIDWNGAMGDSSMESFHVSVEGPFGFVDEHTFTYDGEVWTLSDLVEGDYTVTEDDYSPSWTTDILSSPVRVSAGFDVVCASVEITNTYQPGCLEITKVIDWNNTVNPDSSMESFHVSVEGPFGFVDEHTFTYDGEVWTLSDLVEGDYTVTEDDYSPSWTTDILSSPVTVRPGDIACASVEITNTYNPGCLTITKFVDLTNVTGPISEIPDVDFTITVIGPSYPSGHDLIFELRDGIVSPPQELPNLLEGSYDIDEVPPADWDLVSILPNPAIVTPGMACNEVTVIVKNEPELGCVEVTKVIDWNGVVGTHPDVSFEVCIEGPSYPDGECHIFTAGGSHTFNDLIPGWYWVNETSPGANWSVTNPNNHVEVFADEGCAQVEIINTYQPGCLWVEKLLDLCGAVNLDGIDETFVINVIGPSYPTGFDIDFTMTDGDITSTNPVELSGLIPGDYTVSEPSVPEGWISSGSGSITISPGDECGSKIKSITNHLGRIFIEKYDGTTDEPLGNATFLIESQFNDWSITVVDNGANDYDPRPGMMEVLFVPLDAHPDETCFLVTEIVAPEGYDLSDPQTICLRAGMAAENLVFVDYPLGGCTYTPGYWMTHSWYGPAPYDETWSILGPDGIHELQNHSFYGSDETWLSIMSMKTTSKTKVYQQLAFHYVAAYLNGVYNGHLPSDIEEYLEDASDILGNYANDFKIPRKSMDETTARQITSILGEFNEGCYNIYWPHCDFATVLIHKTNYRDDSPLAGWNFNIQGGPCDVSYDLKTDSEGYIEIYLNPGRYTITEMLPDHWQRIDESDQIIDPFEVVDLSDDEILELEFINLFNHDPEAVDDIYSTDEDTPLVVDVSSGLLANDQDVDGDVIVYIGCSTPPSHGSVSISTDGSFVYTPDENYSGTDSFVYTISDGYFGTDTAMVNITILPVNDPPVAMFTHTEPVYQYGIVSFDASGSFDVDGSIVLYEWDWNNDGTFDNSLSSPSFDWDFSSLGMHTVVLRVTDNEGLTSTVAHTFEVI